MARPKNIGNRGTVNHVFDLDFYHRFVELVGAGNVSEELRAFVRDRVEQERDGNNGSSSSSSTNVLKRDTSEPNYIFQDFESRDKRDEIKKYVELEPDMNKLNILYRNCKTIVGMVEKRKVENKSIGNMENRLRNEKELQDHLNKLEKAKHRTISYRDQDGEIKRI